MDNFDLKKYLVENKVTTNSRMLIAEALPMSGRDYLKAAAEQFWDVDLDSADAEQELEEAGAVDTLPVDVIVWMMDNDEAGTIEEADLEEYLSSNNLKLETVAEYQFVEQSYNFQADKGAGEYASTVEVSRAVDADGHPVKIENYDFVVGTDRGSMGGEYALMDAAHAKVLKSISDIYNVDAGWYVGYKGRTKN